MENRRQRRGIWGRKRKKTEEPLLFLPIGRILPNPARPRRSENDATFPSLVESIRRYGVLQPLTVRVSATGPDRNSACYELITGERRLKAAKQAGLESVPCRVVEADDRRAAILSIIDKTEREGLGMFEEASALGALIDVFGMTPEETATAVGMSAATLAKKLRLLRLTPPERCLVAEHRLTERHATALLKIAEPSLRLSILQGCIRQGLTASQTEAAVDNLLCPPSPNEERRRLVIKDVRLFFNTLDRAVERIERAGVEVTSEKRERGDAIEMVIRLKKRRGVVYDEVQAG